jgi:uncharacterized protein
MPNGKPAGVRCVQLDEANHCQLFGDPTRPAVCLGLQPSASMCGDDAGQALTNLDDLEQATNPLRVIPFLNQTDNKA